MTSKKAEKTELKSILKSSKSILKKKPKTEKSVDKTLSIQEVQTKQKLKKKVKVAQDTNTKRIKKKKNGFQDKGTKNIKKKKKLNVQNTVTKVNGKDIEKQQTKQSEEQSAKCLSFSQMGLDDRIIEGIGGLKWVVPTLVQQQAIPFMLDGKSVVAQARTGSGKTGAFLVPCLHRVLADKESAQQQCVRVVILAPSKELCRQISEMAWQLAKTCVREVRILDLSPQVPLDHQKSMLAEMPDVVVGPPGRVLSHLLEGNLSLEGIQTIVVDEADLMMAYQHSDSLSKIFSSLPELYQCFITSATLSKDLKRINQVLLKNNEALLHNTVVLKLKDPPLPAQGQLTQYIIKIEEFEKAVLLYALYRLKMMTGKTIIFVNSVNKGYKLRMFLGQFGIASCVLNCELPAASRCDIIEQFNAGRYDTIIATDETSLEKESKKYKLDVENDIESGSSRGLDFQFVCNIINFDFPLSAISYIHRVGRTARGHNIGTSLSMVSIKEHDNYLDISNTLTKMMNVGQTNIKGKTNDEGIFKKFVFDLEQLDGFSYRARDVWQMCTSLAIMETRKKEIASQLLNSAQLATFFHDNPNERALLRHDKRQHGIITQHHLKHVPEYLIPDKLRAGNVLMPNKTKQNVKRLQSSSNKLKKNNNKKKHKKSVNAARLKKGFCNDDQSSKTQTKCYDNKKSLTKTQARQAMKKSNPLLGFSCGSSFDAA